jgi:hypothetical protein
VFFRSGWTPPVTEGTVTVRYSHEPRAIVHFPLPAKGDYDVVVRADPVPPDAESSAMILCNRQLAARITLGRTPGRVGSYKFPLPREWTRSGDNELAIVPGTALGVRLWHIRILPMRPSSAAR